MNPAAKILLFLLFLPFLIGIFLFIMLPLLIILLILSCFIPAVRVFHIFQPARGRMKPESAGTRGFPEEDNVYDVECTVVESSDETDGNDSSDRPPERKP